MRRILIAASRSSALRRLATEVSATRRVAERFVAGESLGDALAAARRLNARGMSVSLDYLGEAVDDEAVAKRGTEAYLDALKRIEAADVDASISVKLTQLGLDVTPVLCHDLVGRIAQRAARADRHVTVDMEGSAYTQATVDLVVALRDEGHANLGCAVQSYLHRTPGDVERLVAAGASLRLCKGAYAEPPAVAHQRRREVSRAFLHLADRLLRSETFPRFATHDHRVIAEVRNLAARHRVPSDRFEFQMLYGVRERLQHEIVAQGYGLRVYVPFGDQWYPYLVRRLAERPANLRLFARALVGRRAA